MLLLSPPPPPLSVMRGPARMVPWVTSVSLYGTLFVGGDLVYQGVSPTDDVDWTRTRNVALVAFGFHGNFSFFWMRLLERRFPGNTFRMVARKLLLDQTVAAPLANTVFYTGLWRGGRPGGVWGGSTTSGRGGGYQWRLDLRSRGRQRITWPKSPELLGRFVLGTNFQRSLVIQSRTLKGKRGGMWAFTEFHSQGVGLFLFF